ncbi:hypothetical protein CONPUDRAFT_166381 [Coniophora puteana RWD-64-598 SS2]|uniref:Uncharacterized protein n=1 Tax=Coniophora puteana (strain RWD-64-598) TaxID=741705 RepID=A0A5M3MKQ3_CONPW|nr:uncharacterized protein CONPUDRAFT_166381 [Coniophora puteana RWD-64-598 SS2]EIW79646.1 hypothetical protein CONPUDRAFT_166381 [Coniophora puteana RWD-64-598 SS2]
MLAMRRSILNKVANASSSRLVARPTSCPRSVASISSAAISSDTKYEAVTLQPIFDIFDAPVRLGESSKALGRTGHSAPKPIVNAIDEVDGEKSRKLSMSMLPTSLPPPITFDGPARPPHLVGLAFEKRRKTRLHLSPSLRREAHTPSVPRSSLSDAVFTIFDGPSRITRYQYPSSSQGSSSQPYLLFGLVLSGVVGWLAYQEHMQTRRPTSRSL